MIANSSRFSMEPGCWELKIQKKMSLTHSISSLSYPLQWRDSEVQGEIMFCYLIDC